MKWTKVFLLLLILPNVFACVSVPKTNSPNQLTFFVGTSTNLPTEGIYAYRLD